MENTINPQNDPPNHFSTVRKILQNKLFGKREGRGGFLGYLTLFPGNLQKISTNLKKIRRIYLKKLKNYIFLDSFIALWGGGNPRTFFGYFLRCSRILRNLRTGIWLVGLVSIVRDRLQIITYASGDHCRVNLSALISRYGTCFHH